MNENYFLITYEFTSTSPQDAETLAKEIALEQTVELPQTLIKSQFIETEIIGSVQSINQSSLDRYRAVIAYNPEITGFQIPQFLNVLYGNISIKTNIRIVALSLPKQFLVRFKGANFGVNGIRNITGVRGRPLLCTALKPMGASPQEFAKMAKEFALGGGDILKDDHGLIDHSFSSFHERVSRCQETIIETAQKTGKVTLYFPNILAPFEQMEEQIAFTVKLGIKGILLSPFLIGLDMVRYIAKKYNLIIMLHPALTGTHFNDLRHGIAPEILLGTIFRLIGGDISIFPNHGGRFNLTIEQCKAISVSLSQPLAEIKPALPCPAGGMGIDNIKAMSSLYGEDVIFLIGGSLHGYSDNLTINTQTFKDEIRKHFPDSTESKVETLDVVSSCEINNPIKESIKEHLIFNDDFTWTGRGITEYKKMDNPNYYNIKRQELIGRFGEKTAFDLRYFEIAPDGFSSKERHVHEHVIICICGNGELIIEDISITLKPFDITYVQPLKTHQLRNNSKEPFGFFCIVDHIRDRPIID
ncbi:MAG: cupin domain-containing protein [Nitrospirae bacterium]|nr:cupin domain-containing protein [Nitrospirota bacterium]MBF0541204.1 cupin domain-containing protein [Nitrospirota bacterium]